jgi:BatD DUF11 like domain
MDKKIGNLLLVLSLGLPIIGRATDVSMRILDSDDQVTECVTVDVPFAVEVTITDGPTSIQTPQIAGMKQFVLEDKGHVSTINTVFNGVRSSKKVYRFTLHAPRKGIFSLGPAHVLVDNQRIKSDIVTLTVGDQEVTSNEPIMQLLADKQKVIVGEKINVTLRFYPGNSTSLDGISEPNFKGFSAEPLEGPFTGTAPIKSILRKYIEWRTTIYPEKSGELTIPSVIAVCKLPRKKGSRNLDMFERFFDGGLQQRQIYSKALKITVDELPPYHGTINAIGTFDTLRASIDHAVAKEGEGIVYRLTLIGDGNLRTLTAPELIMPNGLKYYASKSFVDEKNLSHEQQKIFEYIMQGTEPGVYTIPTQQFTYFDLQKRSYQQLKSNEVELTITPIAHNAKSTGLDESNKTVQMNESFSLLPINHSGPWREQKSRHIPWNFFIALCSLPVAAVLVVLTKRMLRAYQHNMSDKHKEGNAFRLASAALKKARKEQDILQVHELFITLFANKFAKLSTEITDEFMNTCLKKAPPVIINEWESYFNELLQGKFGYQEYSSKKKEELFDRADQWLKQLQELL